MAIEKIAFKGNEPSFQTKKVNCTNFTGNLIAEDEEKNSTAKYMIGATALAGIVALGVLGYKGKLGKGIQELLGGAEKATSKTDLPGVSKKPTATDSVLEVKAQETPKVLESQDVTPELPTPKVNTDIASDAKIESASEITQPLKTSAPKTKTDEVVDALNKPLNEIKVYSGEEAVQKIMNDYKALGNRGMQAFIPKNNPNVVVVRSIDGNTHSVYNLKDFQYESKQSLIGFSFDIKSNPISSRSIDCYDNAEILKEDGTIITINRKPNDWLRPRDKAEIITKIVAPDRKMMHIRKSERDGRNIKLINETDKYYK